MPSFSFTAGLAGGIGGAADEYNKILEEQRKEKAELRKQEAMQQREENLIRLRSQTDVEKQGALQRQQLDFQTSPEYIAAEEAKRDREQTNLLETERKKLEMGQEYKSREEQAAIDRNLKILESNKGNMTPSQYSAMRARIESGESFAKAADAMSKGDKGSKQVALDYKHRANYMKDVNKQAFELYPGDSNKDKEKRKQYVNEQMKAYDANAAAILGSGKKKRERTIAEQEGYDKMIEEQSLKITNDLNTQGEPAYKELASEILNTDPRSEKASALREIISKLPSDQQQKLDATLKIMQNKGKTESIKDNEAAKKEVAPLYPEGSIVPQRQMTTGEFFGELGSGLKRSVTGVLNRINPENNPNLVWDNEQGAYVSRQ